MSWDPDFLQRSPMLLPLAIYGAPLSGLADWPRRDALAELAGKRGFTNARGDTLHLVAPDKSGQSYEAQIHTRGEMPVREREWHDLFNVLVWLTYPKAKAALNARHVSAAAAEQDLRRNSGSSTPHENRGRVRDALTALDESGAIVISAVPELLEDLRAFRWKRLFCERRDCVLKSMRFYVFGHALFEKALRPYLGMTAHALPIVVSRDVLAAPLGEQLDHVDALAAACISRTEAVRTPQELLPLPLLGVPGWCAENECESFYDDTLHFRPGRRTQLGHCLKRT